MSAPKREAELKSAFGAEFLRRHPGFLLLALATGGGPDRVIVGNDRTTFWEFKHGTPDFRSPGRQELICMRLAAQTYCRYVVWHEDARGFGLSTLVIHPRQMHRREGWLPVSEARCGGYDHGWLADYIYQVHTR